MRKKQVTREEVNDLLVSDKFFEKGNFWLTFRQGTITLLSWLGVILPVVWLFFPFFYPNLAADIGFLIYKEGLQIFKFLMSFLIYVFIFFIIVFVLLTLHNNHQFKNTYQNKTMYNEKRLEERKEVLNDFYYERFGDKEFRENVTYYSVSEDKNIDTDQIKELYEEKGVQ
ncbi:hypothetical protein [Mycoplasma sp. P36-A1]|uniref:hypothetical protein n=1 Tax=Mycoplasma sp. P36-A1 TaxID=3252900 RepID=UPI003C2CB8C0